ncbi:hypothetical protein O5O45_27855 [Hahella aquimaris]|uniref:hypothetical protein n=1 Tax=Hahella sp. HNIBRBA332 TaxID=3015983 RepID=UPI00273CB71A|nr:hypothetical protein [Hahella sp. HNIBRBA332]WLQ13547.1 hypothetical protein O5O45_27855 [Hahella sp. HNIBRBA332]
MSVGYEHINQTKKERITFAHLPVSTQNEIVGHPVSATMVCWYLMNNIGDDIQFVSDTYDDWPFRSGQRKDYLAYPDRTDAIIATLVQEGVLQEDGVLYLDKDEMWTKTNLIPYTSGRCATSGWITE